MILSAHYVIMSICYLENLYCTVLVLTKPTSCISSYKVQEKPLIRDIQDSELKTGGKKSWIGSTIIRHGLYVGIREQRAKALRVRTASLLCC